jgi:hypothetical protein
MLEITLHLRNRHLENHRNIILLLEGNRKTLRDVRYLKDYKYQIIIMANNLRLNGNVQIAYV